MISSPLQNSNLYRKRFKRIKIQMLQKSFANAWKMSLRQSKVQTKCTLAEGIITSPVGPWKVRTCAKGLHSVKLQENVTNDNFLKLGRNHVKLSHCTKKSTTMVLAENWLQMYFNGKEYPEKIPICDRVASIKSGKFRQKVWLLLTEQVTFGQTVSYGELAKICGNPGANQAVGSAMSNNPISLIVPCHRVIKADGSIGNYSKATKNSIKQWLLDFEKSRNLM